MQAGHSLSLCDCCNLYGLNGTEGSGFESLSYRISRIKRRLEDLSVEVRRREGGGVAAGVAIVDSVERHRNVVG